MAKKEKRFVRTSVESTGFEENSVWMDRETGVNYLFHMDGYGGGLTPLLDREGKPVVSPILNGNQ